VYNDSKLKKTSKFYEIDYLEKADVQKWLRNLEKYSKIKDYTLTEEEIEKVWDTVGGSMWEIQLLLTEFFEEEVEPVCEDYKIKTKNLITDYIYLDDDKELILKHFSKKNILKIEDLKNVDLHRKNKGIISRYGA